jgi:SET domain-containing protein
MPNSQPLIAVRRSKVQGRGVFALVDIPARTRIIEYIGERISSKEADRRSDDESGKRHHTFMFAVSPRRVIDGSRGGNEACIINHSCTPNCRAIDIGGRIFIESIRRVRTGDELSYDYAYLTDPSYTLADLKRLYPCRCGTAKCRGTIAAKPKARRPKAKE